MNTTAENLLKDVRAWFDDTEDERRSMLEWLDAEEDRMDAAGEVRP
jgi:hypothetical protein